MPPDRFGRAIEYLRISLTDMCNLRCVYCMPEDMQFRPREELLQDDELVQLVRVFADLGFSKIRLTGGEPTLRENVVDLVRTMATTPNIGLVAMTTNGILLNRLAEPLAKAGLRRINISIDTTDPERFKRITRWGRLDDVWAGIAAAESAGLEVKLNTVVTRGYNDGEDVIEMARLSLENAWQVRFIELMPFGRIAEFQSTNTVSEEELRTKISGALGPMQLLNQGRLDGEARLFQLEGARGSLGFISSVTRPFCAGCNRARLTADGKLRLCLLRDKELDVRAILRAGADEATLRQHILDSIWHKPWGHGLAENVHPEARVMSEIGG